MDQKVKSILITQPEPAEGLSPYTDLKEKYKVTVTYRAFNVVDPVSAKEFRREKINILDHSAIIFSSKTSIEHFFRLSKEMRVELPADMKYFCVTDQIANFLQKFIVYRKRKVFYPKTKEMEFYDILLKHKTERYLLPCSNIAQNEILDFLKRNNLNYKEGLMYKTVSADLSDLADVNYDVIAFFTPYAIKSLYDNFPDFKQNATRLAAYGNITKQMIIDSGLTLNIEAPTPATPSMKMALEAYIKIVNK